MYIKVCPYPHRCTLPRSETDLTSASLCSQEDLIIPHVSRRDLIFLSLTILELTFFLLQHYTFYDFIVNKARGKSGPLFNFDVHDDVRLVHDASIEKDEVRFRPSSPLQVIHRLTRSLASPR